MTRFSLKSLAGRKFRTILTALAIVLGVAMISGTYVLTDTIDKAFSSIFSDSYAGTDVVVSGKEADFSADFESPSVPPVDASLLDDIRAVDSVELAMGGIYDELNTKIVGEDGKAINTNGAPSFGFGIDTSPEYSVFNPLNLLEGRWPEGDGEVVLDAGTADREDFALGETVAISTLQPVQDFEVVGIAQYGDVKSLGSATFAIFDVATAQTLFDREGEFDAISVAGNEGTTPDELMADIQPILPADAQVKTGAEEAQDQQDEIGEFTTFIRYFLLAFAGIALFVGSFVIFNTLSITVAQRTREFATLRTLGASRRQVLRSVLLEAFVIGFLASVIGLFLGLALAKGLEALFRALGLGLPVSDTVFATRTIVVSLLVGTLITVIAGLFPAIRATRVPPIAAVREGAELPKGRWHRFTPYVALVVIALALFMLGRAMFADDLGTADRLLSIAGGVLLLFVGVAMISSKLVRPLAAVVGLPARWIGGAAGALARRNSIRNPGRTAATAAALMIGVALVAFVATLANGMKASNREAIEDQITANFIITSQDGYTPFVAAAGDAAADAPSVESITHVRSEVAEIAGDGGYLTGIDPELITKGYSFDWVEGSDATLAELGRERDDRRRGLRGGQRSLRRASRDGPNGRDHLDAGGGEGHLQAAAVLSAARRRQHLDRGVRRARRTAAQPVHLRQRRRRAERGKPRGARGGDRRLPRRARADARGVGRQGGRRVRRLPRDALRPARPLGDHQPLRDGQHARALGLRAHPRARNAPRRGNDAAPDPTDDPPRERHHGPDRDRARAAARDLPRHARDPCAERVRSAVLDPDRAAVFLVILAVIVGLLAAITPARRAAKLNPLEALHYE